MFRHQATDRVYLDCKVCLAPTICGTSSKLHALDLKQKSHSSHKAVTRSSGGADCFSKKYIRHGSMGVSSQVQSPQCTRCLTYVSCLHAGLSPLSTRGTQFFPALFPSICVIGRLYHTDMLQGTGCLNLRVTCLTLLLQSTMFVGMPKRRGSGSRCRCLLPYLSLLLPYLATMGPDVLHSYPHWLAKEPQNCLRLGLCLSIFTLWLARYSISDIRVLRTCFDPTRWLLMLLTPFEVALN